MKFIFNGDKVQGYKKDVSFYDNYLFYLKRKNNSFIRTALSYLLTALGVTLSVLSGFVINPIAISGFIITALGLTCSILSTKTLILCSEDVAKISCGEKLSSHELNQMLRAHESYRNKQFNSQNTDDYSNENDSITYEFSDNTEHKKEFSKYEENSRQIDSSVFAESDSIENRL